MYEEKLVIALARAYRVVFQEIEKQLGANDLNLNQFGILEALYHKGEQSLTDLGQRILSINGSMEDSVHYLGRHNLVDLTTSNHIALTNKGTKMMDEIYPVHKAFLTRLFDTIPQDVQASLVDQLKQLYHIHK